MPGSVASMRAMPSCDLRRVAGEFLAEGDRRRVLQMGAADLDDVLEGLRLVVERLEQVPEGRERAGHGSRGPTAMCMAVGNESFDDWPMLTWSFG